MRRTRILSTIGPSSETDDAIAALLAAGTDAFRLNFSHGTADGHVAVAARVRRVAATAGRPVAIVQDLGVASKFNLGRPFLEHLRVIGRAAADRWLAANRDRLGVESSIDIRNVFL